MSIDPEDSLEEALRGDLPSADTERRLRKRLLAAGVAVGNGVVTTTAAAGLASSGAVATGTATTGFVAKVVGLSWGVKLGLAAMVAIPTVGLWLDGRERQSAVTAPVPPALAAPTRTAQPDARSNDEKAAPALEPVTPAPEPERALAKSTKPVLTEPSVAGKDEATPAAHPSQADFSAPAEASARAPQVGSTLADETRLLDAAFAALAAGDRSRAAALIQEHQARYPHGLLQKERERATVRLSEMSRGE